MVADCSGKDLRDLPTSLPPNLDWLLLLDNNISSIDLTNSNVIKYLNHTSKLDLKNNKLFKLPEGFLDIIIKSKKLSYLDISNNSLTTLPQSIQKLKLKTLKLAGNKFKCLCDNVWMKEWMLNNSDMITDYKTVQCQMSSDRPIPVIKMNAEDLGCIPEDFKLWKISGKHYQPIEINICWNEKIILCLFHNKTKLLIYTEKL